MKKEAIEKLKEEAKSSIAIAIEALRRIPEASEDYDTVDTCIRELEDIQILRL